MSVQLALERFLLHLGSPFFFPIVYGPEPSA